MSWFNTQATGSERILYSKARYTRNISKLPFGMGADTKKLTEIYARIDKILSSNGFRGERLASGENATVLSLAEKQFISPDLVSSDGVLMLYLNEPCNLTVALGGAELISIQAIMTGQAVIEAKNSAAVAEQLLDGELTFAYSERVGYLSPLPERCGSGLELSAAMFLPSLRLLCSFEELRYSLSRCGINIAPMFKGGMGDLYTLSYIPEHLENEQQAALYFESVLTELNASEGKSQKMLFPDSELQLSDAAFRAVGLLKSSKRMGEDEMLRLISDIRIYISMCNEDEALPSLTDLSFMGVEGLNCCLLAGTNQKCSTNDELCRIRSELLRKYIAAKLKAEA